MDGWITLPQIKDKYKLFSCSYFYWPLVVAVLLAGSLLSDQSWPDPALPTYPDYQSPAKRNTRSKMVLYCSPKFKQVKSRGYDATGTVLLAAIFFYETYLTNY